MVDEIRTRKITRFSSVFSASNLIPVDPGAEAGSRRPRVHWRCGCVRAEGDGPERCGHDHAVGMAVGSLPRRGGMEAGKLRR